MKSTCVIILALMVSITLISSLSAQAPYEFRITTSESGKGVPEIYGDIVVWADNRNGNLDIYGYDLSTKEEFQITTDEGAQSEPAIYGDIVVWTDERNVNGDIYGYNLSTKEEFPIKNPGSIMNCIQQSTVTLWSGGIIEMAVGTSMGMIL